AGVEARLSQSIWYSSHEGQAARRGQAGDAVGLNHGGSRWFSGADESTPHPTVGIRVGHIEGVDTIWSPIPYTDIDLSDGLDATGGIGANSATIQWVGYGLALLGRQADMQ